MVLEEFYDVGIRSGSFIAISDTGIITALDDIEEPYYSKKKEIVRGMLLLSYKEYSGDFGMQVEEELKAIYQEVSYMCMTFDTVSTIKEAILYLLAMGEDFEDPDILMKAMRTGNL